MKGVVLKPSDTVGILGGGQLGRMLALAAAQYGLKTHIFTPEKESPACDVCAQVTYAAYDDELALEAFAKSVDVITYEFENVPLSTASTVAQYAPLLPGLQALAISQDRLHEKTWIEDLGIPVAPFAAVNSRQELEKALQTLGMPSILKTRRFGYDGKGQMRMSSPQDIESALELLENGPAILEGFVPFEREISVVAARGQDARFVPYEICENIHEHHILAETHVPTHLTQESAQQAIRISEKIAHSLDYVGVLAVEMFVVSTSDGEQLVVNEIAPRVHNSGHWTIEGAHTSQFAQHIRAICGWSLGGVDTRGKVRMRNLIGEEAAQWPALLADPSASLHLYGKTEMRQGRKMGHVTWIDMSSPEGSAHETSEDVRDLKGAKTLL
jgi:5-(carboxyamino)imidazole ribonucleotide synthase